MTNEEYIRWLKLLDDELTFDALVDGKDEMDMHEMIWALCEKLEQEPNEPVGNSDKLDCISRTHLIDLLNKKGIPFNAEINEMIINMPSVQPKTGHWECNELFYEGESRGAIIRCSKCGNEFKVSPKVFESLYDNERFCNHCGAKMEG